MSEGTSARLWLSKGPGATDVGHDGLGIVYQERNLGFKSLNFF